jgi:hypothetical protein
MQAEQKKLIISLFYIIIVENANTFFWFLRYGLCYACSHLTFPFSSYILHLILITLFWLRHIEAQSPYK